MNSPLICHICRSGKIKIFPGYSDLKRVTSDCKPWIKGGVLGCCEKCHTVQKIIDTRFYKDADTIYRQYDVYHQMQGLDQVTFNQNPFHVTSRSETILNSILAKFEVPSKGSYLDIGCGKGNMLKAFSRRLPGWQLHGFDLNESSRNEIESIKNVKSYYTGNLTSIRDKFDLLSIIHVLEHIPYPAKYLAQIKHFLKDTGLLIIEVPNLLENPFDLLIADHATHFTENRLKSLLNESGFEVIFLSKNIIAKELTMVVKKSLKKNISQSYKQEKIIDTFIEESINWLEWIKNKVEEISAKEKIGLFGAGIASAWLIGEFSEKIEFCVDEDVNKINKNYFGKPVIEPKLVKNRKILIPMPHAISKKISERWSGINGNIYFSVPELTWKK